MPAFRFKSELWTAQYTGVKVNTLSAFTKALSKADEDTIYYHLYRNLFEYHFLPTDYPNSFAYWLAENGFPVLAEKFSAIDLMEFTSLGEVKSLLVSILEEYRGNGEKMCKPFYFIRAVRKVIDTGLVAENMEEFKRGIMEAGIHSLFYHLVSSRLVHEEAVNDFSLWLREMGEEEKAKEIEKLDLMASSLYEVRERIREILER
ncbi:MAG: hypothetical protein GXO18_07995 [Aquificae bacterium]|nr:hypothetical protein [Aquificota bacterium]